MNVISVLFPYKHEGMWVFDDPEVGLRREPFVFGIDDMITRLVSSIPGAENGFRLLFSPMPFPGYAAKLEWRREEYGGNWYFCRNLGLKGGCVPRCSSILTKRPRNSTRRPSQRVFEIRLTNDY